MTAMAWNELPEQRGLRDRNNVDSVTGIRGIRKAVGKGFSVEELSGVYLPSCVNGFFEDPITLSNPNNILLS
jgi:hypothetical protein